MSDVFENTVDSDNPIFVIAGSPSWHVSYFLQLKSSHVMPSGWRFCAVRKSAFDDSRNSGSNSMNFNDESIYDNLVDGNRSWIMNYLYYKDWSL